MSTVNKRKSEVRALVNTGDMGAKDHMESIKHKVSKGKFSSRKQMSFCTYHNRFDCKHMHHVCVNEIGFKVVEESSSHDHDAMIEEHKVSLPNHVKE